MCPRPRFALCLIFFVSIALRGADENLAAPAISPDGKWVVCTGKTVADKPGAPGDDACRAADDSAVARRTI